MEIQAVPINKSVAVATLIGPGARRPTWNARAL